MLALGHNYQPAQNRQVHNLAEAHASLGQIVFYYDYDWSGAEREYKRAIELNPNYATTYQWYGELLAALGRSDEAIEKMKMALELEPVNLIFNSTLGLVLWHAGKYDEAITQLKNTIELDPNFAQSYQILGMAYEAKRMFPETLANYSKVNEMLGRDPKSLSGMKEIYEREGWDGFWRRSLKDFTRTSEQGESVDFVIALQYAHLRNSDRAILYLNKAFEERDWTMPVVKVTPAFKYLHDDPRFKDIVKRMGFPE